MVEGRGERISARGSQSGGAPSQVYHRRMKVRRRFVELRTSARGFFLRHLPNESQHLFALTLGVGAVCGLIAVAFHLTIHLLERVLIERALEAEGWSRAWIVLVPTLGGLVAGAALAFLPGARGSGVPQVKQAFATEGGRIRFRDALGKFAIAAFQIGSGASLGREGPTVHICAGATSMLARVTALPPRNMRRLMPVGVAAGIAAAFNAPIAAVTFTIEEIVGTLDHAVLSGVVVAAAIAAVIERGLLGAHPIIEVRAAYGLEHASSLPVYALLGLVAAFVAVAFTDGLLKTRRAFRNLKVVRSWAHPALGGLVTGLLAAGTLAWLGTTGVTGGGYETLGHALGGQLPLRTLVVLCAAKLVATVLSYSSGGAGGIFAPSLFIGAMLGGAVGHLDVEILGHAAPQLGAFALVGMGAVFAGVIRAPITSVLIIFEMTGSYGLVLPLMLANMTSYVIARRLRPVPIYEALLEQDGIHLPREKKQTAHPAELLTVADAMTDDVLAASADATVEELKALVDGKSFVLLPVVDETETVKGIVRAADIRTAPAQATVRELLRPAQTIRIDQPLVRAMIRMSDAGVRQLVVLDEPGLHLVGILTMSDVVQSHARALRSAEQPKATTSLPSQPSLTAASVMMSADVIAGATKLPELRDRLKDGGRRAFVVVDSEGQLSVIVPEHLDEVASYRELDSVLIAADVARPAPILTLDSDLSELATLFADARETLAAIVDETRAPVGVVTRAALAETMLDGFAHRLLDRRAGPSADTAEPLEVE